MQSALISNMSNMSNMVFVKEYQLFLLYNLHVGIYFVSTINTWESTILFVKSHRAGVIKNKECEFVT